MTDTPPPPPPAPDQGGTPLTPPPSQPYSQPAAPTYGQPTAGQGYGQQTQGYGQPAYAQPAAYAPTAGPRTNPLAIAALIASCAGVIIWVAAPIAGAIMGHIALGQIKRTGENGHGMALAGVLVGWILAGLQIIGIVAYIIFIVALVAAGSTYGSSGY